MLKIGIIGTRGIPNHYGGFEQLAQYLSVALVKKGHQVTVYNSHDHPYREKTWNGVNIIHCFDPEYLLGTAGQFIYDLNCTINTRKQKFDVLLVLGYTSSSVWGWLYSQKTVRINHMDGLEWQRQKYGALTRRFLQYAEKLAIRFGHFFISDAAAIHSYLSGKYHIESEYIAYGAEIPEPATAPDSLPGNPFYLLIARMEKENNIEMILDGMHLSNSTNHFVVVGNTNNSFGKKLVHKYRNDNRIQFTGSIYDQAKTAALKQNCILYFHGHSVGGTNPSLLEAMAAGAVVCAHNNVYNRAILEEHGFYFSSATEVKGLIENGLGTVEREQVINSNLAKIRTLYNWPLIVNRYDQFIRACYHQMNP